MTVHFPFVVSTMQKLLTLNIVYVRVCVTMSMTKFNTVCNECLCAYNTR